MKEKLNSPIWKGSSGPLFIKSVWIDNGNYRHFILDKNISRIKKKNSLTKAHTINHFDSHFVEEEFENLQLIGSSEIGCTKRNHDSCGNNEKKNSTENGKTDSGRKPQKQRVSFERLKRQIHENINNKHSRHTKKDTTDLSVINSSLNDNGYLKLNSDASTPKSPIKINEITKNQLTERVLNWLDLAGKNTLIRPETAMPALNTIKTNDIENNNNNSSNMNDIPKRRILTTESLKKVPLRKAESVHHLSLTLNEDELDLYNNRRFFEASSRCTSALKFGEFFPTTYRCSRKFLSSSSIHSSRKGLSFPSLNNNFPGYLNLATQMEQTSKSTKKSTNQKKVDPVQLQKMEKEYKSMIHRQILENSCNTQIAKRQLHIFMPNLPKQQTVNNQECDSCLSTIVSEVSHKN